MATRNPVTVDKNPAVRGRQPMTDANGVACCDCSGCWVALRPCDCSEGGVANKYFITCENIRWTGLRVWKLGGSGPCYKVDSSYPSVGSVPIDAALVDPPGPGEYFSTCAECCEDCCTCNECPKINRLSRVVMSWNSWTVWRSAIAGQCGSDPAPPSVDCSQGCALPPDPGTCATFRATAYADIIQISGAVLEFQNCGHDGIVGSDYALWSKVITASVANCQNEQCVLGCHQTGLQCCSLQPKVVTAFAIYYCATGEWRYGVEGHTPLSPCVPNAASYGEGTIAGTPCFDGAVSKMIDSGCVDPGNISCVGCGTFPFGIACCPACVGNVHLAQVKRARWVSAATLAPIDLFCDPPE